MLNCLSGKTSVFIKEFPCKSLCPCMPARKYVMAYWERCRGNLTWGKGRTYLSLRTWLMPRMKRMHRLSLARLPALVVCPTLPWAEVPGRFQQHMQALMDWVPVSASSQDADSLVSSELWHLCCVSKLLRGFDVCALKRSDSTSPEVSRSVLKTRCIWCMCIMTRPLGPHQS